MAPARTRLVVTTASPPLKPIRFLLTALLPRPTMELLKVVLEFVFKMVAHRYISVAMTALVLACPFQCGECSGMCPTHACVDSDGCNPCDHACCGCNCERDGQPLRDHDYPDGSNKVDCFCNGAVLSDSTKCPDLDVDRGFFGVVAMNGSSIRQFAGTHSGDPALLHGSHFPPLVSGRDIRALVSSYLL